MSVRRSGQCFFEVEPQQEYAAPKTDVPFEEPFTVGRVYRIYHGFLVVNKHKLSVQLVNLTNISMTP